MVALLMQMICAGVVCAELKQEVALHQFGGEETIGALNELLAGQKDCRIMVPGRKPTRWETWKPGGEENANAWVLGEPQNIEDVMEALAPYHGTGLVIRNADTGHRFGEGRSNSAIIVVLGQEFEESDDPAKVIAERMGYIVEHRGHVGIGWYDGASSTFENFHGDQGYAHAKVFLDGNKGAIPVGTSFYCVGNQIGISAQRRWQLDESVLGRAEEARKSLPADAELDQRFKMVEELFEILMPARTGEALTDPKLIIYGAFWPQIRDRALKSGDHTYVDRFAANLYRAAASGGESCTVIVKTAKDGGVVKYASRRDAKKDNWTTHAGSTTTLPFELAKGYYHFKIERNGTETGSKSDVYCQGTNLPITVDE